MSHTATTAKATTPGDMLEGRYLRLGEALREARNQLEVANRHAGRIRAHRSDYREAILGLHEDLTNLLNEVGTTYAEVFGKTSGSFKEQTRYITSRPDEDDAIEETV